jgi:hypothetical protein
MSAFGLAEPSEMRPVRCGAKRAPGSALACEMAALHRYGYPLLAGFHSARDRAGRWHFWSAA